MILALLRLGLILFFPRILKMVISLITNRRKLGSYVRISLPSSKSKLLRCSFAAAFLIFMILRITGYIPEASYFKETSTPLNSPAYMIRNHYRAHMEKLKTENPLVHEYLDSLGSDESLAARPVPDGPFSETHLALSRLETLARDLKINENKNIYTTFGEDAFSNCHHCDKRSPLDYSIFILPLVAFSYIAFLASLGIICFAKEKKKMLIPGIFIATIAASYEGLNHYMFSMKSDSILLRVPSLHDSFMSQCEILAILRYSVFIPALALALILDLPPLPNETVELMKDASNRLKTIIEKQVSARISRSLILTDDELRKPFLENNVVRASRTLASITPLKPEL